MLLLIKKQYICRRNLNRSYFINYYSSGQGEYSIAV